MATNNPYVKYQDQAVNTATPEELTLMLYNGCIKFMNIAEIAIEEKKIEQRNLNLQKAQAIVMELIVTLNEEIEISKNLKSLYLFVNERLMDANIRNDKQALSEAKLIIADLRDTWKEAMKLARR